MQDLVFTIEKIEVSDAYGGVLGSGSVASGSSDAFDQLRFALSGNRLPVIFFSKAIAKNDGKTCDSQYKNEKNESGSVLHVCVYSFWGILN